ncbi:GNAT family N-acetyltransferase [Lentzea sp. CC55]|uniref:GNAT family N-acetyltransferase n=1 Tax=Lentzea sp. CC55 TaxID=2884909 RepID=UPI0027DF9B74|nr:GNAT family N-acetyltransferase [Lentzea sp. CC55]MCG8927840.1 GNAT family N-acetyltransferase [Lentzea sp. CC55]
MIRAYDPSDLDALYDICLDTGEGGQGARHLFDDPRLLGHAYVGPYVAFEPDLAFVAEDDLGVCGYALATADTEAFEDRCDRDWWPDLRVRYPLRPNANRVVQLVHRPARVDPIMVRAYPAHLHANLLPRAQGRGLGGALVRSVLERLEKGVHVHVRHHNTHAIGFWEHLGFRVIDSADELVLGLRL